MVKDLFVVIKQNVDILVGCFKKHIFKKIRSTNQQQTLRETSYIRSVVGIYIIFKISTLAVTSRMIFRSLALNVSQL